MNESSANRIIASAFFVEIAFITWQEVSVGKQMPQPRRYVGAAIITGILQTAAPFISEELASIFAVGFAIGIIFNAHKQGVQSFPNALPKSPQNPNGQPPSTSPPGQGNFGQIPGTTGGIPGTG